MQNRTWIAFKNLSWRTTAATFMTVLLLVALPVATALAVGAGPRFPLTGADASAVGSVGWTSPDSIGANDNSNATVSLGNGAISHYLKGTGFGFSIPTDATINGILVTVGRSGTRNAPNEIRDSTVSLVKAGTVTGSNKAVASYWPAAEGPANYGGGADLWGTTWAPADINSSNFGVVLSALNYKFGGSKPSSNTASVDYITVTVTYTPRTVTTLNVAAATATYGSTVNLSATLSPAVGGKTVSFTLNGSSVGSAQTNTAGEATLSSVSLAGFGAGSYASAVGASFAGDSGYAPSSGTALLTINQRPLTIQANSTSKTYGNTVTFAGTEFSATGLITGDTVTSVTLSSAGTAEGAPVAGSPYAIVPSTAVGTGLANYGITYANGSLTVSRKSASATPDSAGKTYGDTDPAFSGTLSGFLAGDNVTAAYARAAGETAAGGPYTISATLSPAGVLGNYDITYNTAAFSIGRRNASWTTDPAGKNYGDADPDPLTTGSGANFVAADGIMATYGRAAGELVSGSPYHITATLGPAGVLNNYNIIANAGADFTVSPAASYTVVTVSDAVYDGSSHGASASVTGGGGLGQGLTVSYEGRNGTIYGPSTAAPAEGGAYTATAAFDGDANHNASSSSKNFAITPAGSTTTVTVSDAVYDGSSHGGSASVTGIGGFDQSLTVTYEGRNGTAYGPSTTAPTDRGEYTASAAFAGDANHGSSSDSQDFVVAQTYSTTTVTATDAAYDGSPHGATASVEGTGGLDQSLTVHYTGRNGTAYGSSTIAPSDAGEYVASAHYVGNMNYTGSGDSKYFTITPAGSTTAVAVSDTVYDGTSHGASASVIGAGGLDQSLTVSYEGRNGTAYGLSTTPPADAGEYSASAAFAGDVNHTGSNDTQNFAITARPITVTATGVDKPYDGTTAATVNLTTDKLAGDDVTAGYTGADFDSADIGPRDISVSGISISGSDAANYSLTNTDATASASIILKEASVTPQAANKSFHGADPLFTGALTGFVDSDGITATFEREPGEDAGDYTISATLSPADALGHYHITYNTAIFTINPPPPNTPPAAVYLDGTREINEYSPADTVIGTLSTDDTDSEDSWTYTLQDNIGGCDGSGNGSFHIGGVNLDELRSAAVLDYELQHDYSVCIQVEDRSGATAHASFLIAVLNRPGVIASYRSSGRNDGHILESAFNSNVGGPVSSSGSTFFLGDSATRRQYLGMLSFNTRSLPDNALITKVTLQIKRYAKAGDPFSLGDLVVESKMPSFGTGASLQAADFQYSAGVIQSGEAPMTDGPKGSWYSIDLDPAAYDAWVNKTGTTQLRLRLSTKTNGNAVADLLKYYSGNAAGASSKPVLIVEYAVPDTSLSFKSAGAADGYVTESASLPGTGKSINSTGGTANVGDSKTNLQYRPILSFNTAALPDNAVVTKVTLKIRRSGALAGDPFGLGDLMVDIRKPNFGAKVGLEAADFQDGLPLTPVGTIANSPDSRGWYTVELDPAAFGSVNLTGTTQLRLRFGGSDTDGIADILKFYSGNTLIGSNKPLLIVEFTIP